MKTRATKFRLLAAGAAIGCVGLAVVPATASSTPKLAFRKVMYVDTQMWAAKASSWPRRSHTG